MKATVLKSLLVLWNSQGLFQGDGSRVQQYCKSWCLTQEQEQRVDLLKVQTLASNPDVYKALFEPLADIAEEQEWRTLEGAEIDESAVMAEIERWQRQREEL